VTLKRQGGFQADVPLQFRNVPAGVKLANTTLKAGVTEQTLKLVADENAKPGQYRINVVVPVRVGNQNLTQNFSLELTVK